MMKQPQKQVLDCKGVDIGQFFGSNVIRQLYRAKSIQKNAKSQVHNTSQPVIKPQDPVMLLHAPFAATCQTDASALVFESTSRQTIQAAINSSVHAGVKGVEVEKQKNARYTIYQQELFHNQVGISNAQRRRPNPAKLQYGLMMKNRAEYRQRIYIDRASTKMSSHRASAQQHSQCESPETQRRSPSPQFGQHSMTKQSNQSQKQINMQKHQVIQIDFNTSETVNNEKINRSYIRQVAKGGAGFSLSHHKRQQQRSKLNDSIKKCSPNDQNAHYCSETLPTNRMPIMEQSFDSRAICGLRTSQTADQKQINRNQQKNNHHQNSQIHDFSDYSFCLQSEASQLDIQELEHIPFKVTKFEARVYDGVKNMKGIRPISAIESVSAYSNTIGKDSQARSRLRHGSELNINQTHHNTVAYGHIQNLSEPPVITPFDSFKIGVPQSLAKGTRPTTANSQSNLKRRVLYPPQSRDFKTMLSKSFRALSKGVNNNFQNKSEAKIVKEDQPQFFTKQIQMTEQQHNSGRKQIPRNNYLLLNARRRNSQRSKIADKSPSAWGAMPVMIPIIVLNGIDAVEGYFEGNNN